MSSRWRQHMLSHFKRCFHTFVAVLIIETSFHLILHFPGVFGRMQKTGGHVFGRSNSSYLQQSWRTFGIPREISNRPRSPSRLGSAAQKLSSRCLSATCKLFSYSISYSKYNNQSISCYETGMCQCGNFIVSSGDFLMIFFESFCSENNCGNTGTNRVDYREPGSACIPNTATPTRWQLPHSRSCTGILVMTNFSKPAD